MNLRLPSLAGIVLATLLLAGCGGAASDAGDHVASSVAVTTTQPVKRQFSDSIGATGSAISSPRRVRQLSLAHAGEVVAVMVSNGQTVHGGEALLKIATAPDARKAFKQARNALALARDELARDQKLAAQHLATRSQVATARKAVADAEAAVQAQRRLGGAAAVNTVSAPGNGVVTDIQVTRGQRVPANASLLVFTPAQGLIAQLGVQPDQAAQIKPGMRVTLQSVYGNADDATGRIRMVGHALDPHTHLVPVQVAIPAELAARLVAGAALSAGIRIASYTAWSVPRKALRHDDKGDYLFQVDHGHAQRVPVTVRSPAGHSVGVIGKLDPQLPVVVLGAHELTQGMAVREQAR